MNDCRYWPFCSYFKDHGCAVRKCEHYKMMPDRVALLMLADEMEKWALTCDHYDRQVSPLDVTKYARRIREACGEVVE